MFTTAMNQVKKTRSFPFGYAIEFCIILILIRAVLTQSVNRENWNEGGGQVKFRLNCDFPGRNIESFESSGEICGSLCIANRECTHFRHHIDGFCYLKKIPLSTPVTSTKDGMCGFVPWKFEAGRDHWNTERSGVKWLINCDFFGHDIDREPSSADLCGGICLANPECNHFRFSTDGFCYVKNAPLSISRTASNGGVCGYIPSREFMPKDNSSAVQDFCECVCV